MDRCPECRAAMTTPDADDATLRIWTCPKCGLHVAEAWGDLSLASSNTVHVDTTNGTVTVNLPHSWTMKVSAR